MFKAISVWYLFLSLIFFSAEALRALELSGIFIVTIFLQNMVKLKCNDYGFECDFSVEGETEKVIEDFRSHTEDVHGIDYSKEAIMQFILRKQG